MKGKLWIRNELLFRNVAVSRARWHHHLWNKNGSVNFSSSYLRSCNSPGFFFCCWFCCLRSASFCCNVFVGLIVDGEWAKGGVLCENGDFDKVGDAKGIPLKLDAMFLLKSYESWAAFADDDADDDDDENVCVWLFLGGFGAANWDGALCFDGFKSELCETLIGDDFLVDAIGAWTGL